MTAQSQVLKIRRPDDWHIHLRDDDMLKTVVPYTSEFYGRAIVMPNLVPPVTTVDAAIPAAERHLQADEAVQKERALAAAEGRRAQISATRDAVLARAPHLPTQTLQAYDELMSIDGIGAVVAQSLCATFAQAKERASIDALVAQLDVQDAQIAAITSCPTIAAIPGNRLQSFADIRQITMYKTPSVAIAPRIWPYTSSETRCIDIQNAS